MSNKRPGKIAEAARRADKPVTDFLIELVEQSGGIAAAAHSLGVHPFAVRNALTNAGYRVETWQSARVVPANEPIA